LRRLHSLTGILPIGLFLVLHLTTNSSLAWGRFALRGEGEGMSVAEGGVRYFQHEVSWINESIPHLLLLEIVLWVSIGFHAILGVYYATTGKSNVQRYSYQDNWRYTLQRWTGYVGIIFIFYHVATLRWGWTWLVPEGTRWSHSFAASALAASIQGSTEGITPLGVLVAVLYMVGITALVFHFANGLWTAAITWGITTSERAMKRWGYACAGLGAMLMLAGWSSLGAALVLDYDEAHAVERDYFLHSNSEEDYEAYIQKRGITPADRALDTEPGEVPPVRAGEGH
jgi:succinate dehydrogenase / fumarate reductase cytochrome b subunit